MSWFNVAQIAPAVWQLSEPIGRIEPRFGVETVNMHLVVGRECAALIDTGMGIGNLRDAIRELCHVPVIVCNTHFHWDHSGGNSQFDQIAIHEAEAIVLAREQDVSGIRAQMAKPDVRTILPVDFDGPVYRIAPTQATQTLLDGDDIDLGGRTLTVIHTPGHSPGHVSYYDAANGLLFSGDTAYCGAMYACFKGSDPFAFQQSAHRLAEIAPDVKLIAPGHNQILQGGQFVIDLAEAMDETMNGDVEGLPPDDFIGGCEFRFGAFSVWLPKDISESRR
jgi:glyoxylase-like metal-dependent hydrolase (beta-lactamase superfamily II)